MFNETIFIKKKSEIRYGNTTIPYEKTFGEILALLSKHGCDQIATSKDHEKQRIAFVYQDNPYVITVPQVYIKDTFEPKIGIRLVKYYLEILLDWTKMRIIDFEFLMLGSRMMDIDGNNFTLKEAVDQLPKAELFKPLITEALPGEEIIDLKKE